MIDLSVLRYVDCAPTLLEFGGVIEPDTGAAEQRVDRMGDRWSFQCETPRVKLEPEGRLWSALLTRAKKVGGRVPIEQRDFDVGTPGIPVVAAATASGRTIPVAGLTPGYAVKAGQWLNYTDGEVIYLDQVEQQVLADASGTALIVIQNLLRAPLGVSATITLEDPVVEGWIKGVLQWPVGLDGMTKFTFAVSERA